MQSPNKVSGTLDHITFSVLLVYLCEVVREDTHLHTNILCETPPDHLFKETTMSDEDEEYGFDEEEIEQYMSDGDEVHEEDSTAEEDIRQHMDFSTVIVIENLPKVPADKFEKLKQVILTKIFIKAGAIVKDKFAMPLNPDGTTKGLVSIG